MKVQKNNIKDTIFLYSSYDLNKVVEEKDLCIKQTKLFISKHKEYTYIHRISKEPWGEWSLIFKVVPKDANTVKKYNELFEISSQQFLEDYLFNELKLRV